MLVGESFFVRAGVQIFGSVCCAPVTCFLSPCFNEVKVRKALCFVFSFRFSFLLHFSQAHNEAHSPKGIIPSPEQKVSYLSFCFASFCCSFMVESLGSQRH